MALALPGEEFSLAFSEIAERFRGDKQPPFHEVTDATVTRRVEYSKATYRDRVTGRYASLKKWKRSHGAGGRYVRKIETVPALTEQAAELPAIEHDAGPFETLDEAGQQFPPVTLGVSMVGESLDDALAVLGLQPYRIRVQGAYQRIAGEDFYIWQWDSESTGGLDQASLATLVYAMTREFLADAKSPPTILVNRIEAQPK